MKQLFNLFGMFGAKANKQGSAYQPHAVVQDAIESVVEGTEPRIRLVSGYQKKLQKEVAGGKSVYFPKRKELKRLHLEAKFDELRKRGGDKAVDKALAKRRKKNKSKDAGLLGRTQS